MLSGGGLQRRVIDGLTMFVVTALSLLLLVYVGYGEGRRTYERFHVEKLTAQGAIVENAINGFLRAGLPLRQFVGFNTLAEPIVADEAIDALAAYDLAGKQIFIETDKSQPKLPETSPAIKTIKDKPKLTTGDGYYQMVLPLRTRFETVGSVVVYSSSKTVDARLEAAFRPLLLVVVGLSAVFATLVTVTARHLARLRAPWLQIAYAVTFLTMSGFVIVTLASLYSDGVQGKARSAAFTLAQRLHDVVEFNLRFRDFDGLDAVFAEFTRVNQEISKASLVVEGKTLISSATGDKGKPWEADSNHFEYIAPLTAPDQTRKVELAVAIPVDIVYQRVEGSIRNFAALFVASAFLAGLFLQVAASMQRLAMPALNLAGRLGSAAIREESALSVVKPIFFLAVFLENMTYSFLPQHMQAVAATSGMSVGVASVPFTAYYLMFALSLIPGGHLCDRYGPKPLIWGGLVVAAASMLSLTLPVSIVWIALIRALAGGGQGFLFIGIQAYILAVASPEKKTQGGAIIVFGFQGGMISGMAIGSLLVNYIHPDGVFLISAAIGVAAALYSMLLIPKDAARQLAQPATSFALGRVLRDLARVMRDFEFLKAMLLIGVPAKAILTGVVTFAMPLLFGKIGFHSEEIGQIIMMYGIGVVITSSYVSRLVDRTGRTELILFWGALISGAGLVTVGFTGMGAVLPGAAGTALMVVGVIVVGIAHGFINAPVVTHVAHSRLAGQLGVNTVTATYRFLERVGHVFGPVLMGQCFLIWGTDLKIIVWSGIVAGVLGLLFFVGTPTSRRQEPVVQQGQESVS
jgi:predicted MFS family arabinose efflux permease